MSVTNKPERIRVAQDADGFWTCREAISGSQEYVRADIFEAALSSRSAEAGKPVVKVSIDTMREAAWELLIKQDWKAGSQLSGHSAVGLMAEFGMRVYRGEVGCGYPDCGCCADAACEDAIKQHADFAAPVADIEPVSVPEVVSHER